MSKYLGNNQYSNLSPEERFWQKVRKTSADECWEWLASKNRHGYGIFRMEKESYAHRVSYKIANSTIPEGMHVLHKCDNPSCVNPSHLFLGTHKDNMQDMLQKGRNISFSGQENGNSKITKVQAIEIREKYADGGVTQQEIADEFGITQAQVHHITSSKQWSQIDAPVTIKHKSKRLSKAEVKEMLTLYETGKYSQTRLAEIFSVSQAAVWYQLNRHGLLSK